MHVVRFCALGAACGAIVTAVAPGVAVATLGIVICGASLAGVYPAVLGIAGERFQSHSGTVFGILFTVALAGGMILPWLAGQIGGAAGLRWVFVMVAGAFTAIVLLTFLLRRGSEDAILVP